VNIKYLISVVLFLALIISGCSDDKEADQSSDQSSEKQSTTATETKDTAASETPKTFNGPVIGTFDSGGYTYLHISTPYGPVWAAGPITAVKKNDQVSFVGKMLMKNFLAKSMNRTFDEIYFVYAFTVNGVEAVGTPSPNETMSAGMGSKMDPHGGGTAPASAAKSPFKTMPKKAFSKAEKGQTIAEILADTGKFKGKNVKIRGRVTKYTSDILGKNWVHIQDSGAGNDLTITTTSIAKIDDILLVEGKLELQKDYGEGFVIDVVVDNAKVTVE